MEVIWPPGFRKKDMDDSFFQQGNIFCLLDSKKYFCYLENEDENKKAFFECKEKNCNKEFLSLVLYQLHYDTHHRTFCSQCQLILPSQYLLDLHIAERHSSSLFNTKNQWTCLVVGCNFIASSEVLRKQHLFKSHGYPNSFRYYHYLGNKINKVNLSKCDRNTSKDHTNKSTLKHTEKVCRSEVTNNHLEGNDVEAMEIEVPQINSSKKVPKTICFGNKSKKAFSSKKFT